MKPELSTLMTLCPELDRDLARQHLERLGTEYFNLYDPRQIAEHVRGLAQLNDKRPVIVTLSPAADNCVECTILAFDYPSLFSLITGVITGLDLDIVSGDVFTYSRRESSAAHDRSRGAAARRRRIIDRFVCRRNSQHFSPAQLREQVETALRDILQLLAGCRTQRMAEARRMVNERVTARLIEQELPREPVLYPVNINIESAPDRKATRLSVRSQDTPAFLYSVSTALALQDLQIEHVIIRTRAGRADDRIDLTDARGRPITGEGELDRIRLTVLLTKQFTYFLDRAPAPYDALSRFEQIVQDVIQQPERSEWLGMLSQPRAMQDLARLLGASDFLWEDFIRLQHESLMPILRRQVGDRKLSTDDRDLQLKLDALIERSDNFEEQCAALNSFKDREIYLIDLDHIISSGAGLRELSQRLTSLAEVVVRTAVRLVYGELRQRHGVPRTVAGLESHFAVLGLGKLGGAALGYASDIELLFVYADRGRTDGVEPLDNGDFYCRLATGTARAIRSKREGIFQVDLRLRPYGDSGPPATSLEQFCRYYSRGGEAHSFERLALIRLRAIAGHRMLGQRIERLRDSMVYDPAAIKLGELRRLRRRQFEEKRQPGRTNAKFGPGALVDLEYAVQILQVMHGGRHSGLRTPRMHAALEELPGAGVADRDTIHRLSDAYDFLRRLINGLRMLRGSARDLYLPAADSDEYRHLARRMGYSRREGLSAANQLKLDFETHTAAVRAFVEEHFGRDSLPGKPRGTVADLILNESSDPAEEKRILSAAGFNDTARAALNLRRLAGHGRRLEAFIPLALLACDMLGREPDPDMALNNWERFVQAVEDPEGHFSVFLAQPRRLDVLLRIFSRSQFLADMLIRHPEEADRLTAPGRLQAPVTAAGLEEELERLSRRAATHQDWLNTLRMFRKREMLRIATRDICLQLPVSRVTAELSALADTCLGAALKRRGGQRSGLCIMALGKLGGAELNYSSDIDLLAVCNNENDEGRITAMEDVIRGLRHDISAHTEEGYAYRVDLRLRPHGRAGRVVLPLSALLRYYRRQAGLWEIQALLKLRPVAGDLEFGRRVQEELQLLLKQERTWEGISAEIRSRRESDNRCRADDVKNGSGGIRDIEFLVQALQLANAARQPRLLDNNTLGAIRRLRRHDLLGRQESRLLWDAYQWLRRLEHYLQIMEDRQTHSLPADSASCRALACRIYNRSADENELKNELRRVCDGIEQLWAARLARNIHKNG